MLKSTPEVESLISELRDLRDHKKMVEKREEDLKQQLYNHMNEHEELVTEDGEIIVTWKYASDSQYFDAKKFQTEAPDLYEQYILTRPGTRRLVIK